MTTKQKTGVCPRKSLGGFNYTDIGVVFRTDKELRRANDILKAASAFFAQAELDRRIKS